MKLTRTRGFTLLEMMAVVAILGIVFAFLGPTIMGQSDKAKSQNMLKTADAARAALERYYDECGTPKTVAANPLIAASKTIEDVIFGGEANISATYLPPTTSCVAKSGVRALDKLAKPNGAGGYSVESYAVTLTDIATPVATGTVFAGVPKELLESLLASTATNVTVNAAGDSTGTRIRYSAPTAGRYTVTVLSK